MKKKFTGKSGTAWWAPDDPMRNGYPTLWTIRWPNMIRVKWSIRPVAKKGKK